MKYTYKQLRSPDIDMFKALMQIFAQVFEDSESYLKHAPDDEYIRHVLSDDSLVVFVIVTEEGLVIGGVVAYVLQKFEQNRRELYIYDFAVSPDYQRQRAGSGLIVALKKFANKHGMYDIFVQADKDDSGALAFYRNFSTNESEGYVFDIGIEPT